VNGDRHYLLKHSFSYNEVYVDMAMPPYWGVEYRAFKVKDGEYRLTGNLLHAAGTINMVVKFKMENGEKIELSYKIVVPGKIRFNES
jgi:copper transport protein